jgi:predicted RNase H-like nuclease (RuvC/YqgF family)
MQQPEKKGKGKGEPVDPIQEEIKQLKSTIVKQDEEIYLLKDMVKSTALQIRVKEGELKRVKRNMDTSSSMPASPGGKHRRGNNSTLLPSLKNNESDYGQDANTMRDNSKLDKLTELSSKFKSV